MWGILFIIVCTMPLAFAKNKTQASKKEVSVVILNKNLKGKDFTKKGFNVAHPKKKERHVLSVTRRDYFFHKHDLEKHINKLDNFEKDMLIHRIKNLPKNEWAKIYKDIPTKKLINLKKDL